MQISTWPESEPFWDATAADPAQLLLQSCQSCERPIHFPRVVCPHCGSQEVALLPATGRGTVHAATVVHTRGPARLRERSPYVVAIVELDEGVRLISNVFGIAPHDVKVGLRVQVTFEDVGDPSGRRLPVFEPEEQA